MSEIVTVYPYHDDYGAVLYEIVRYMPKDFRLRRPDGNGGYTWNLDGVRRVPYRLPQLQAATKRGKTLWIPEGEKDADALAAFDLCATTSAMGCGWAWTLEFVGAFDGALRCVVVTDCDAPGRKAAQARAELLAAICDDVRILDLAPDRHDGYDVSDWLADGHVHDELLALSEQAPRATPFQGAVTPGNAYNIATKHGEARPGSTLLLQGDLQPNNTLQQNDPPPELACTPDLLAAMAADLKRAGVAGEDRFAKVLTLAVVSRYLDRPISVVAKGPSAAGKSFLVEQTLKFFPASAYFVLTAMSERMLVYFEEPLAHRMLVIYEAAGMAGDMQAYVIRSLLSENRLRYGTVEKIKGKQKGRVIEREGPTGLITTTTAATLHPENETRLLSIPVNDTNEQTKEIMRAAASDGQSETVDYDRWHKLHEWLDTAAKRVQLDFAGELVEAIPPVAIRLRRDINTVLGLIRAHAILHQATRQKAEDGRIRATIEGDYRPVYDLIIELFSEGVEATVPKTVRETVAAAETLLRSGEATTTVRSLVKALKLDRTVVYRRVSRAIDLGYLKTVDTEKKRGGALQIALDEPLPAEGVGLLPEPRHLLQRSDLLQVGLQQENPAATGEERFVAFCCNGFRG